MAVRWDLLPSVQKQAKAIKGFAGSVKAFLDKHYSPEMKKNSNPTPEQRKKMRRY